jgi:hypothetical protein
MLEYILRGLLNGSVYALLALPMTLFFTTAATVDFAIGAYALLAAAVGDRHSRASGYRSRPVQCLAGIVCHGRHLRVAQAHGR